MRKALLYVLIGTIISCGSKEDSTYEFIDTRDNITPSVLTIEESDFLNEYEYVTFKKDPNSYGASLSEKWSGEIKLFLDGNVTDQYRTKVSNTLAVYNELFSDGTSTVLSDTLGVANVHLYRGPVSEIETLWPDMYNWAKKGNFSGYAHYNSQGKSFIIWRGRIWVGNSGMPIFSHELGHIIGLGHASRTYCNDNSSSKSFMCSSLSNEFSSFDKAIIKILYHTKIERGKNFEELKPIIQDLLVNDEIEL